MEGLVEDDPVLPLHHPVAHVPGLHLGEGLRPVVRLVAAVARGARLRPVEVPVPEIITLVTTTFTYDLNNVQI